MMIGFSTVSTGSKAAGNIVPAIRVDDRAGGESVVENFESIAVNEASFNGLPVKAVSFEVGGSFVNDAYLNEFGSFPDKSLHIRVPSRKSLMTGAVDEAHRISKLRNFLESALGRISRDKPNEFLLFEERIRGLFREAFLSQSETSSLLRNVRSFFSRFCEENLPVNRVNEVRNLFDHLLRNIGAMAVFGIMNSVCLEIRRHTPHRSFN